MRRSIIVLSALALTLLSTAAFAAWLVTSSNANGFSKAATIIPGIPPSADVTGSNITVSWGKATFGGSTGVNGYIVKRYNTDGAVQIILDQCLGPIAALSCTEQAVPSGDWKYTVTPVHGSWSGTESAFSNSVTVASGEASVTFPSPITVLPSTPQGETSNFIVGEELTFAIDGIEISSTQTVVSETGGGPFSIDLSGALSQGQHTLTVTSDSDEAETTFTVDTVGPFVDITFPGNGVITSTQWNTGCDTPTPDICGTATDATTGVESVSVSIKRSDDTYYDGTAFVSSPNAIYLATGGSPEDWSITLGTLSDNTYTVTAAALDNAGFLSTDLATFTIDSQAPDVPVLTNSTPSSPSNNATPVVHGTSQNEVAIELYGNSACNGTLLGSGNANGSGAFSINATVSTNATTTVYGLAKDDAGNTSACSSTFVSYVHDGQAPAMPVITGVTPTISNTVTTPTVSGTRESGAIVKLYTDALCTTLASGTNTDSLSGGTFSISPTVSQNSTTTFRAQASDAVGNTSACSAPSSAYTHDSIVPTPVITSTDPVSPSQTDNTPMFLGTGEPGSVVQIRATCAGTSLGSTTVALDGSWTITPAAAVTANLNHQRWAFATDGAGNTACSAEPITYRLDTAAPQGESVELVGKATGNTVGTLEAGDQLILTYSEAMKSSSILADWNGAETDIRVRFTNQGSNGNNDDTITFHDTSVGSTLLGLGSIDAKNNYVTSSTTPATFNAKMTLSNDKTTVTIVLGTLASGAVQPDPGQAKAEWIPSGSAQDLSGRACLVPAANNAIKEAGNDADF